MNSEKRPWLIPLLMLLGFFFIVIVIRYLIVEDIDFGFSIIIAVLIMFIYFIAQRLIKHVRNKDM
jgi:hypothetical protein